MRSPYLLSIPVYFLQITSELCAPRVVFTKDSFVFPSEYLKIGAPRVVLARESRTKKEKTGGMRTNIEKKGISWNNETFFLFSILPSESFPRRNSVVDTTRVLSSQQILSVTVPNVLRELRCIQFFYVKVEVPNIPKLRRAIC